MPDYTECRLSTSSGPCAAGPSSPAPYLRREWATLRNRWDAVRRWWPVGVAVIIAASAGGMIVRYVQMRANYDLCEIADPQIVQGPSGDRVLMDTRFCSQLTGDPGTIVVRFQRAGSDHRGIILAYNPTSPQPDSPNPPWYPDVSWFGSHRILMSIGQISQLQRQRDGDGDVHFVYRIGKVDYPKR